MNNSLKLKLTLDIAAKTTALFLTLVIYAGIPALLICVWLYIMRVAIGD